MHKKSTVSRMHARLIGDDEEPSEEPAAVAQENDIAKDSSDSLSQPSQIEKMLEVTMKTGEIVDKSKDKKSDTIVTIEETDDVDIVDEMKSPNCDFCSYKGCDENDVKKHMYILHNMKSPSEDKASGKEKATKNMTINRRRSRRNKSRTVPTTDESSVSQQANLKEYLLDSPSFSCPKCNDKLSLNVLVEHTESCNKVVVDTENQDNLSVDNTEEDSSTTEKDTTETVIQENNEKKGNTETMSNDKCDKTVKEKDFSTNKRS